MNNYIYPEIFEISVRKEILLGLRRNLDEGHKDPAFLYLGGRFACSLALENETQKWVKTYGDYYGKDHVGYFPFGILLLHVLKKDEEKKEMFTHLNKLVESSNPRMKVLLNDFASFVMELNEETNVSSEIYQLNKEIDKQANDLFELIQLPDNLLKFKKDDKTDLTSLELKEMIKDLNIFQQLQFLSKHASEAYEANNTNSARLILEQMLLINGDQPDVLRNLITITSDQMDVEAHERYWKRYIRLLLWRILNNNNKESAIKDLFLFYSKVAGIIEGICNKEQELPKYLIKIGFLSKWLEANSALVWLTSAFEVNTHKTPDDLTISLNNRFTHFWIQVFYPEFGKYFNKKEYLSCSFFTLPTYKIKYGLTHDPAYIILKRFLEWSKYNYGLPIDPNTHQLDPKALQIDTLAALAGLVCKIPLRYYLKHLSEEVVFEKDIAANESINNWISECCKMPFGLKVNTCFLSNEVDWKAIIAYFGDVEIKNRIKDKYILFYIARAYLEEKDSYNFYGSVEDLLRMIKHDEKLGDQLYTDLIEGMIGYWLSIFQNDDVSDNELHDEEFDEEVVLHLKHISGEEYHNLDMGGRKAAQLSYFLSNRKLKSNDNELKSFIEKIVKMIKETIENLKYKKIIDDILENIKTCFEKGELEKAKEEILKLPDLAQLEDLKTNYLRQVDEALKQKTINDLINRKMENVKKYFQSGDLIKAREEINSLPNEPEDIKELKTNYLRQVDEALKQKAINDLINKKMENVKKYFQSGDFKKAREEINSLPNEPKDIKELKTNYLRQVDEALKQKAINDLINRKMENVKKYFQSGDLIKAREEINSLPNEPEDIKELKANLLKQIKEQENIQKESVSINKLIESVLSEVKECSQNGDYAGAKKAIQKLPDSPSEIFKLKNDYLDQIKSAENDLLKKISELMEQIESKGIDKSKIFDIAEQNNFKIDSPIRVFQFLNALMNSLNK